jgi:hypothetical protein
MIKTITYIILSVSLLAALVGCGGNGQGGSTGVTDNIAVNTPEKVAEPVVESVTILPKKSVENPEIFQNNWDFFYNISQINLRYLGETFYNNPVMWDYYPYTGTENAEFTLTNTEWTIGGIPPSITTIDGNEIGMFINSESFDRTEVVGGGPHMIWSYLWDKSEGPDVWANNKSLNISFEAKVPFYETTGNGVGQYSLVIYGVDEDGKDWCYLINLFEPRGKYKPLAMYDTFVHFASSPIETSDYMVVNEGEFSDVAWEDYRKYSIDISPENMKKAMSTINSNKDGHKVSENVLKMKITSVHMLLEVVYDSGSSVAIGAAFKDFELRLED